MEITREFSATIQNASLYRAFPLIQLAKIEAIPPNPTIHSQR